MSLLYLCCVFIVSSSVSMVCIGIQSLFVFTGLYKESKVFIGMKNLSSLCRVFSGLCNLCNIFIGLKSYKGLFTSIMVCKSKSVQRTYSIFSSLLVVDVFISIYSSLKVFIPLISLSPPTISSSHWYILGFRVLGL